MTSLVLEKNNSSSFTNSDNNPLFGIIGYEIIKRKINNAIRDIEQGKISKETVLEIIHYIHLEGLIEMQFYIDSIKAVSDIKVPA